MTEMLFKAMRSPQERAQLYSLFQDAVLHCERCGLCRTRKNVVVGEGSLQAVFSGHDHVNDFCALYRGVYLVYSQGGGYNTYSMEDRKGWNERDCHYGVTLTTLLPDGNLQITPERYADLPAENA